MITLLETCLHQRKLSTREVAKVAQFCSVQPTAPKAPRKQNLCCYYILAFSFNFWQFQLCLQNHAGQRRFALVQSAWQRCQTFQLITSLLISKNAKSATDVFKKSQTPIFSEMVNISCMNDKVSLISTKLYPRVGLNHFS